MEGTGSWSVGLARFLADVGVVTVEVDRPNRQVRRKVGKSDPTDAVAAARAARVFWTCLWGFRRGPRCIAWILADNRWRPI